MFDLNSYRAVFASLLFIAGFIAMPANAQTFETPSAKAGYRSSDTYCSNRGTRIKMGNLSCLWVDGRVFLARCGMSLNSPVWREVQDSCPSEYNTLVDQSAATSSSSRPGTN